MTQARNWNSAKALLAKTIVGLARVCGEHDFLHVHLESPRQVSQNFDWPLYD